MRNERKRNGKNRGGKKKGGKGGGKERKAKERGKGSISGKTFFGFFQNKVAVSQSSFGFYNFHPTPKSQPSTLSLATYLSPFSVSLCLESPTCSLIGANCKR